MSKRILLLTSSFLAAVIATPAMANDVQVQALQKQIEQMQAMFQAQNKQLESLQSEIKQLKSTPAPAPKVVVADAPKGADGKAPALVTEGSFPGSMTVPGTDISVKLGGQVKLDAMYTPKQTAGLSEDLLQTRTIQATGTAKAPRFRAHARDTRLSLDVRKDAGEFGPFKLFVETDFYGGTGATYPQDQFNGYDLRMRQAYVQIGEFLVGQTWSTFNDTSAIPETLDFALVNGVSAVRQPQIRWTHKFDKETGVALALENPEGDVFDNVTPSTGRRTNADGLPDVIAQIRTEQTWGSLQADAMVRRIKVLDTTASIEDSVTGYGANISGKIKTPLIGEKDNLRFQVNYGKGIGRYINDLQSTSTETFDAAVDASNSAIEPLKAYGVGAGYQAVFNDHWRSNLVGGYVHVNQPDYQPGSALKNTTYAGFNVIWTPFSKFDLGVEALYGKRQNKDRSDGDVTRFSTSAKYSF